MFTLTDEEIDEMHRQDEDKHMLYMQHADSMEYFLEWFFRDSVENNNVSIEALFWYHENILEKRMMSFMTIKIDDWMKTIRKISGFQKITILEKIRDDDDCHNLLPDGCLSEICTLLNEVNKESFRTASD